MEKIHFIGIGGAGMSGLARILAQQGVCVTGSDLKESSTLETLRRDYGIPAKAGHAAENVQDPTLVVISAAVKRDNPEVLKARSLDIPVIQRAEMLGRLMARYPRSIAVSGTHGKTTTTGMIALVLEAGNLDPTVLIGGNLPVYGGNAHLGSSEYFLAEACEAYDSFIELDPQIAVVTNIEADHLDYYGNLENVRRSFRQFFSQVTGMVIVNSEDENIRKVLADLPALRAVSYGLEEGAMLRACEIDAQGLNPSYTARWREMPLGRITLSVPGMHNVINSLAAVAVGLELGVPFASIATGLHDFTGTGRRFETLGETKNGVLVVDDYAHHPTEIRTTLAAARRAYPARHIVAVFQPHLPSRTQDFMSEFAESFSDADHVILTDIFLAREQPINGVSGGVLAALTADRYGAERVTYVADKAALPERLAVLTQPGDLVMTMGAGDIRTAGEDFLKL